MGLDRLMYDRSHMSVANFGGLTVVKHLTPGERYQQEKRRKQARQLAVINRLAAPWLQSLKGEKQ